MTEDEAETKWCPFARVASPILDTTRTWNGSNPKIGAETVNRGRRQDEWPLCIASTCMAWRWTGKNVPNTITAIAAHMRENAVGPLDATGATGIPTGYCGLAGAPQ